MAIGAAQWGPVQLIRANFTCLSSSGSSSGSGSSRDPQQQQPLPALAVIQTADQLLSVIQLLANLTASSILFAGDVRVPAATWPANLNVSYSMELAGLPPPCVRPILDLYRVHAFVNLVDPSVVLELTNLQLQNLCGFAFPSNTGGGGVVRV